jgi:Domain of unknown function (DUF1707)
MPEPNLRVSDAERDAAVERLRSAGADGRLATDELEQRVSGALGARTRGDLDALLADLPASRLPAGPEAARGLVIPPDDRELMLRRNTAAFLGPNLVCLAVWAATGAGGFWPKWVLLVTGVWYVLFLVRYGLGVEDEHDHRPTRDRGRGRRRERR